MLSGCVFVCQGTRAGGTASGWCICDAHCRIGQPKCRSCHDCRETKYCSVNSISSLKQQVHKEDRTSKILSNLCLQWLLQREKSYFQSNICCWPRIQSRFLKWISELGHWSKETLWCSHSEETRQIISPNRQSFEYCVTQYGLHSLVVRLWQRRRKHLLWGLGYM